MDKYLMIHLAQVAMTLLTTFEEGLRLVKIIKPIIKIIEKCKDRSYKSQQKTVQESIRACLNGLNKKLQENEVALKVQL